MTPTKILSTPNKPTGHKVVSRLAWVLCAAILIAAVVTSATMLPEQFADYGIFQVVGALAIFIAFPVFAMTGALIVSRQPANTVGWLLIVVACLVFVWPLDSYFNSFAQPPAEPSAFFIMGMWFWGWLWLWLIFPVLFIPLFFPTGRLPSPRWRWLVVFGLGLCAFFILFVTFLKEWRALDDSWGLTNPIGFHSLAFPMLLWSVLLLSFAAFSVASLFVRYRRAQTEERKQIKWLLYAAGIFFVIYTAGFVRSDSTGTVNEIFNALLNLGILAFPIAIGIAILRYRLYDIDIIIRKTLQYTAVTALLALIYFGSVFLLQRLFSDITGEQSPLVLVVSTLLIAALFAPLRRRIQDGIDRRFYRKKYNAQQVLAQFARTARDETDMDALLAELERVVQETLQPEGVRVWICKETKGRARPGLPMLVLQSDGADHG